MLGNDKNKNNNNNFEYISLQDASKLCIYSQEYLSLRARQGKLKSMKLGRNWVTTKEWLQEYVNKVEEYNNSINNNGHKKSASRQAEKIVREEIVKDQIIHYPPENLPIVRYPKLRFNLGTLRPGFALALVLVLITAGGVFGKESLFETYNDVARAGEKIIRNMGTVSDDVFTATVNYKSIFDSVPGILSDYGRWVKNNYSVADEKAEQKIGNALLSLSPKEINQWIDKTYRDISRGYSTTNEAVEKKISDFISLRITLPRVTMPKITMPDIDIGEKISNGRKIIFNNYFAINEKVEQGIGQVLLFLGDAYSFADRSIEQKFTILIEDFVDGGQKIVKTPVVGNFVKQKLVEIRQNIKNFKDGFGSETMRLVRSVGEPFVKTYKSIVKGIKFAALPWRGVVPTEELEKEPVVVKRVEVSKVVEPVKEVTRETIQQVTKIDDAALAEVRANMAYLETEIGKRLYAPGGVVSQTIYVTEPVSSPKIFQENGEIVLQTLGSGNIILTAATGLQLYGQQVVIESTSKLSPLIYLASPTRINGAVTVAGDLTAGEIHGTDITGSTLTGTTLNLSGSISATGATSTFGGIEATGLKMTTDATNGYVLTSDASGYGTWQAATGGSSGTNTWDWIVSGSDMYSTSTAVKIGIATTTPRSKLDVWGDMAIGTSSAGKWNTGTTTPAFYVLSGDGGQVGIGTTTLAGLFTVGTTTQALFVDGAGRLGINGVTYSWPSSQGGASTVLTNDSSGNLTWAAAAGGTNTWDWIVDGTTMYSSTTVSIVGISTTTPRYTLDVWGDLAVGTSTGVGAPMNYSLLYVNSGEGGSSNGVGIGTTTLAGLLTVGTSTPSLVVALNGYVGVDTAGPDRRLDILDISNPQLRLTYADNSIYTDLQTTASGHLFINPSGGNVGIATSTPYSKLTINESNDFAFGDFNASTVDTMEGSHLNWHTNNPIYVSTSTETSIVKTGGQSLKIYASTTPEDVVVRRIYSTAQNFSAGMERLGFWIYADKIATSSATTTQIISIGIYSSANPATATTTKQIYIQEEDRWQYEEWTVQGLANATSVDELFFRIDVNDISTVNFYIDQIRLYNATERSGEMFVGKDGALVLMGRGGVEIGRADGSSNLPGIKVDSAVVELGQPLSVNMGGNVGFDYDLEFLNTGLAQITSEGPLRIAAGDSNHSENLTLATGGSGDVIVELTASSSTFMVTHGWDASNTVPFIINSETYATTSLDGLGILFQIISDASSTDPTSQDDENVVFEIDAFGGYYFDGTSHALAGDVAENYYIEDENIGGGDVVCLNGTPLTVEKCSQSYQDDLIGVVSTRPALLMAADFEKSRAVALAGRVPVKISAENGPITIGDPLTSASSTPGTAMKATSAGKILGYALEEYNPNTTNTDLNATNQILAFINLQDRSSGDLTVYQNPEGNLEVKTMTQNGLAMLFSIDEEGALVVDKLKIQQLCVGSVCVTEDDFMRVFGAGVVSDVGSPKSTNPVCENGANRPCSSSVGACQIGVEICEQGIWGECIGAVTPSQELCDEVDNDCDGETDEGNICSALAEPAPGPETATSTEPIIEPEFESSTTTDETATST